MTAQRAIELAETHLNYLKGAVGVDLSVSDQSPEKTEEGSLFDDNSAKSIQSGNPLDGLASNLPFLVAPDGSIRALSPDELKQRPKA